MKLDLIDKKLLSYVYHHFREPYTKIAKKCNISRDQVEYRIKKYNSSGLVKGYLTMFNYKSLGYNQLGFIFLKLKSPEMKEEVMLEIRKVSTIITIGSIMPSYDLFTTIVSKNNEDFNEVFYDLIDRIKTKINSQEYFIITSTHLYPLKIFGVKEKSTYSLISESKEVSLSNKEVSILKALEKGSNSKIIDLARESKISSELAIYIIKKLKSSNILLGSRIQFNMSKLGYSFTVIRINVDNLNKETQSRMIYFAKEHKNIDSITFGISEFNCIIQILHQNQEELTKTIRDIYSQFGKNIKKSDLLLVGEDEVIRTLPPIMKIK
ncbi:MAG: Lrp/AsnC family transcriptional regulator [Nanoarchaeota archaeon]